MSGVSAKLRKRVFASLACLLAATAVRAQKTADPCGDPRLESQGWYQLDGKVSKVIDGQTMQVTRPDGAPMFRVRIAGIAVDARKQFSDQAKKRLQEQLLNKPVVVLVQPWLDEPPRRITAVVLSNDGESDIGLGLLQEGLVRFKRPPAYTVPAYSLCQYRRTEAEAQSKKLGIWQ